jgi:tRNA A37 N6-isopentenylltransferase MiaA
MLEIVPIKQSEAKAFVEQNHRHHKPPIGSIFQIACAKDGEVVGVIIVGRPVARHLDDGWVLEVNRLATDGTKNACSILYSAAWRVARNLGYKKLITYILESETGASLHASNWREVGARGGGSWNVKSRPRVDEHPLQKKILFEIE